MVPSCFLHRHDDRCSAHYHATHYSYQTENREMVRSWEIRSISVCFHRAVNERGETGDAPLPRRHATRSPSEQRGSQQRRSPTLEENNVPHPSVERTALHTCRSRARRRRRRRSQHTHSFPHLCVDCAVARQPCFLPRRRGCVRAGPLAAQSYSTGDAVGRVPSAGGLRC